MVGNRISGIEVYRALDRAIRDSRRRAEQVRADLDKLDDFVNELNARRGHSLVELAQHYLPDITATTVQAQFNEVRHDLQRLMQKKQAQEQKLQTSWDACLDRRSALDAKLDNVTEQLNDVAKRRDELDLELADRLRSDPRFQELSQQALAAETELKRNEERVAEMREEVAAKLPAYEKSRLFKYLHRRGFGTPEYQAKGLTRRLDRWVARVVNYNENRRSYNFLKVTPELMAAEVERRRADFTALMESIEAIEDGIADEIGLTEVLREGTDLGREREQILAQIDEVDQQRAQIEAELARFEANENEYYVAGVNRLKQFLGSMEESALAARTRQTPQTTDDAIFREIQDCNRQLRESKQRSHDDRDQLEIWHEKIAGLDQVVRRFRSSEFDSRRSLFSRRLNIRDEVDNYLEGRNTAQGLWTVIKKNQEFARQWNDDSWDSGSWSGSWGGRKKRGWGSVFDSDVSHVLGRVLVEVAGEAMRQAAQRGMHRRGPTRQKSRRSSGKPTYRRNGGFTSGRGF